MKGKFYEGFVAGIAYAAARMKEDEMDAHDLITSSNIPLEDFKKYAAIEDLTDARIEDYY